MSVLAILAGSVAILASAYRFYGSYVARKLDIDNDKITPAHTQEDSVDYVPSNRYVVLGHHFASIAGAGPIVGPVIAVSFGWIPALIWIILGGIFFGAVHDIASMTASLRHRGKSIGEIIRLYIGDTGKKLFLIFAFATLLLVIAVFMDIVARTFVSVPSAASASIFFILLALLSGRFEQLWPVFGSANQLLAALALLAGTVWLAKQNINPVFMVIPMIFMFSVTLLSLLIFTWNQIQQGSWFLSMISIALFALALVLVVMARNSLKQFYGEETMKETKSDLGTVSH